MKSVISASALALASADWEQFKTTYGKVYNGPEHELEHRQVYEANMQWAEEHSDAQVSFGETQFADLTQVQFRNKVGFGYLPAPNRDLPLLGVHTHNGHELAESVDWTTNGAVTAVKNQGQCGSCWAFSTTGGMEGAWQIATGYLHSMSEQQLVDCSTQNGGCNGGDMGMAFDFAKDTSIATEESYPYTGVGKTCQSSYNVAIPQGGVVGYMQVGKSTDDMKSALMQGPVSIAIEADQMSFQLYHGGVLEDGRGLFQHCGTKLDHGVLAVGYTATAFKVKNSWGNTWGENGYIQLSTSGNTCGILSDATYPLVSSASVAV